MPVLREEALDRVASLAALHRDGTGTPERPPGSAVSSTRRFTIWWVAV